MALPLSSQNSHFFQVTHVNQHCEGCQYCLHWDNSSPPRKCRHVTTTAPEQSEHTLITYPPTRADELDSEHVDQQSGSMSRSSSRSFLCPDCGLGVESIAALTVHLLTHAQLRSDATRCHSQQGRQQSCRQQLDGLDEAVNSRRRPQTDDDDYHDVDMMNTDEDCSTSVNHVQSQHHHNHPTTDNSCTDDLDTSAQGHSDVELADDEPKCLKVRQTEDALETVVRLECPYCQRKDFDSVGPLTSHIRTAHARPSDNLFTCASCGLAFATVDKLDQHRRVEHDTRTSSTSAISAASSSGQGSPGVDSEPRFLCRFCPVQFYDAQTQRDHEQSIHLGRTSVGNQIPAVSASVVFCSQCSLGFPHIYALADHMHHSHGYNALARVRGAAPPGTDTQAARNPVRPTAVRADSQRAATSATCSDCSAAFDTEDELESHVASAHYLSLGTEYGCTSCLKLFAKPEDLQKHLMDVHAHQLYRCTLCKQVFDSKVNIQVHFAVKHSNECQVYRCSRCSTVFHSEMEWHLHVRVHHLGVARPFRCLFCREGFTTDSDLAAHVSTHNKPFACPVCGESFLVEFLLDRHLETHHRCTADVVGPPAAVTVTLPSILASCLPLDAAASLLYAQVTSPKCVEAMRSAVLSPAGVKREDTYYSESGRADDANPSVSTSIASQTPSKSQHAINASVLATAAALATTDKLSGTAVALKTGLSSVSDKLHQCVYCTQSFKSKGELERHVKATHVMPTTSQKCNICDEVFPSAAVLAQHKLTHCKVVQGNVCVVCRETMKSEDEFYAHCQQHHAAAIAAAALAASSSSSNPGGSTVAPPPSSIPCIVCRQTLVSALELTLHARHHYRSASTNNQQAACCMCSTTEGPLAPLCTTATSPYTYYICLSCERRNGLSQLSLVDAVSNSKSFQCIKCQQAFSTEDQVRAHVATHVLQDGNIHRCLLCTGHGDVVFDSPARLQAHLVSEHELAGATEQACEICGLTMCGPVAARQHALDHGPAAWKHACPHCPLKFFFAAELCNHQLAEGHHAAAASPGLTQASPGVREASRGLQLSDDLQLKCSDCSRVFSGYASLCSHRRVHEKTNAASTTSLSVPLDCCAPSQRAAERSGSAPSRCTSTEGQGHGHGRSQGQGRAYSQCISERPRPGSALECPECSRQFPSLSSLQGHMRVHSSGTKYSCDECGKSFSLPQNLAIHASSHRDEQRLHECAKCHKRFTKKENLKSHMRSHSTSTEGTTTKAAALQSSSQNPDYFSVQRLLGGSCDKTPTRIPRRQPHIKPAMTAAEHLCPVCGGRFTQPSDLALHLSKIHSVKTEIVDMATDGGTADPLALPLTSLADSLALQLYREHDLHTSPALSVK